MTATIDANDQGREETEAMDTNEIEKRLSDLERTNRRWRATNAVLLVGLVALGAAPLANAKKKAAVTPAAEPAAPADIAAKSITITDGTHTTTITAGGMGVTNGKVVGVYSFDRVELNEENGPYAPTTFFSVRFIDGIGTSLQMDRGPAMSAIEAFVPVPPDGEPDTQAASLSVGKTTVGEDGVATRK
jgi:hypothetical protein